MFEHGEMAEASQLAALAQRFRPAVLAAEQTLPVAEAFLPLLPLDGLPRGSRVSVSGAGATSITMALLAEASRGGSWTAIVGVPSWGWAASVRSGVAAQRTVVVDEPPVSQWGQVIAALVDTFDLVVVDPTHQVTASDARRLAARTRERGSVMVDVRVDDGRRRFRWPIDADLSFSVSTSAWSGLGDGFGRLDDRELTVSASGRRGADRQRRIQVRLDGSGHLAAAASMNTTPMNAAPTNAAPTNTAALPAVDPTAPKRRLRSVG